MNTKWALFIKTRRRPGKAVRSDERLAEVFFDGNSRDRKRRPQIFIRAFRRRRKAFRARRIFATDTPGGDGNRRDKIPLEIYVIVLYTV